MAVHTPADQLERARHETGGDALRLLARSPYPFVCQALAANPATEPDTLLELTGARDSPWNDNRLLRLLAEHPRADRTVLRAVLDAVAARLAEGERPYCATWDARRMPWTSLSSPPTAGGRTCSRSTTRTIWTSTPG